MDDQLLRIRNEYGSIFVTRLPSGHTIPWRPLTMGEYVSYNNMFATGQYPNAYIENEIFKKCVLDKSFVNSIDYQKAGIVTTVVTTIMSYSGPQSGSELNEMINMSRAVVDSAIHVSVEIICRAFPAYKPEDVYAMDYNTLTLRLAQAERKLMIAGILKEPLTFFDTNNVEDQDKQTKEREKRLEKSKNLMDDYLKQQGIEVPESTKRARDVKRKQIFNHDLSSTIPSSMEKTIITNSDIMEHESALVGHEHDIVNKIKATNETAQFYKEYLDQLKDGKKLRILTPVERKAAAEKRMEVNRLKNLERQKQIIEQNKKELPELLKVREDAKRRKEKRKERKAAKLHK